MSCKHCGRLTNWGHEKHCKDYGPVDVYSEFEKHSMLKEFVYAMAYSGNAKAKSLVEKLESKKDPDA